MTSGGAGHPGERILTRLESPKGNGAPPVLSVCIPTYNGAAFLAEAMKSVLDQNFAEFELIVVDDASTDATVEVATSFDDRRIRHFRNRVNRGLIGNWNRCVELARGTYVCIFHQDDVMMPGNLAAKVDLLDRNPRAGFVHSNVLQVGPQGELLSEWWSPRPPPEEVGVHAGARLLDQLLQGGNTVCAPSVVLRRDCLEALGPFDGRLPYTADWEMWMRVAAFFDVGYLREPLVKYRRHEFSETLKFQGADGLEHAYRAKALVLAKCGREIPAAEHRKGQLRRQYWGVALQAALRSAESEDYGEACRYLRAAAKFTGGEGASPPGAEDVRLQAARVELEQVRAELDRVRGRVAAMESSKFWNLRRAWFRLKRALHLPADE
jgi:Glycosyl transferase family 2